MSIGMRIFFAVLTLVTTLAIAVLAVVGFVGHTNDGGHMYPVGIVCTLLVALFSVFIYHDYQFFFGPKPAASTKPTAPAMPPSLDETNKS